MLPPWDPDGDSNCTRLCPPPEIPAMAPQLNPLKTQSLSPVLVLWSHFRICWKSLPYSSTDLNYVSKKLFQTLLGVGNSISSLDIWAKIRVGVSLWLFQSSHKREPFLICSSIIPYLFIFFTLFLERQILNFCPVYQFILLRFISFCVLFKKLLQNSGSLKFSPLFSSRGSVVYIFFLHLDLWSISN